MIETELLTIPSRKACAWPTEAQTLGVRHGPSAFCFAQEWSPQSPWKMFPKALAAWVARLRQEAPQAVAGSMLHRVDASFGVGFPGLCVATELAQSLVDTLTIAHRYADAMARADGGSDGGSDGDGDVPEVSVWISGGAARGMWLPHADVDVTVLTPSGEHPTLARWLDAFLYPLWDAGLRVGHAVRSIAEHASIVRSDATVRTSACDARVLRADWETYPKRQALALEAALHMRRALQDSASRRYLQDEMPCWLASVPATVYRLEPDLKNDPGGLRDAHYLWWAARLGLKVQRWADLVSLGIVGRDQLQQFLAAQDALVCMRLALHAQAGRHQDRLLFPHQEGVAMRMLDRLPNDDIEDKHAEKRAADALLGFYYIHAQNLRSVVSLALEHIRARIFPVGGLDVRPVAGFHLLQTRKAWLGSEAADDGTSKNAPLHRGQLTLRSGDQFLREPADLLRIFRVCQQHGFGMYRRAREAVAAAAASGITPELWCMRIDVATQARALLSGLQDGGLALEWMHRLGVLQALIPEWSGVQGLVQRDLYHRYTVDAHLVFCAQTTVRLLGGRDLAPELPKPPPWLVQIAGRIRQPLVLVLAALLHDIGKGRGGGHSEKGAEIAAVAGARLRLLPQDVEDLVFLVRHHLAMFKIALRRDLDDIETLSDFAALIESRQRLDMLVVLSYADAVTTGPEVWTGWKATLMQQLYIGTRNILRDRVELESAAQRAASRKEDVRMLLTSIYDSSEASAAQEHIERLPTAHWVTYRPVLICRHLHILATLHANAKCVSISLQHEPGFDRWELVVAAPDRIGLLADLAGALAASGVSIHGAYVSHADDGVALDTFHLAEPIPAKWQDCVDQKPSPKTDDWMLELQAVALGDAEVLQRCTRRLKERQRAETLLQKGAPRSHIACAFDPDVRPGLAVLDLFAPDKVGLLHDIARALTQEEVTIQRARISTQGGRAADAFYLASTSAEDGLDETAQKRVCAALLAVLE